MHEVFSKHEVTLLLPGMNICPVPLTEHSAIVRQMMILPQWELRPGLKHVKYYPLNTLVELDIPEQSIWSYISRRKEFFTHTSVVKTLSWLRLS